MAGIPASTANGAVWLHIHVPKTGGGSIVYPALKKFGKRKALRLANKSEREAPWLKTYAARTAATAELSFGCAKMVTGHVHWGLREFLGGRPYFYTVVLRDPAERLWSAWHYFVSGTGWFSSFEEFLYSFERGTENNRYNFAVLRDTQTFLLAGGCYDMEKAKAHLSACALVGFTSSLPRFRECLVPFIGWKLPERHVRKNDEKPMLPARLKTEIYKLESMDTELFAWAEEKFGSG